MHMQTQLIFQDSSNNSTQSIFLVFINMYPISCRLPVLATKSIQVCLQYTMILFQISKIAFLMGSQLSRAMCIIVSNRGWNSDHIFAQFCKHITYTYAMAVPIVFCTNCRNDRSQSNHDLLLELVPFCSNKTYNPCHCRINGISFLYMSCYVSTTFVSAKCTATHDMKATVKLRIYNTHLLLAFS